MCGRFTLHTPIDDLIARFSLPGIDFDFPPSYNVAPTQNVLTVLAKNERPAATLMQWGLTPAWSRQPLINARLETIATKPTFSQLVNSKRCLILADGFFEWKKNNNGKYPVYFTLERGQSFAFAGLWDDEAAPRCTIVTTEASSFIKPIHHRMPVILTPETEKLWLSPEPFKEIQKLLPKEHPPLQYHRVSSLVNSPRNNDVTCIEEIK